MKNIKGEAILLISSILFGFTVVFQKNASLYVNPFIVNAGRFLIGALFLTPFLFKKDNTDLKGLIKYGFILGIILFMAPNFQQIAVGYVNVGKVSFISACYIFFVPIINFLFLKRKAKLNIIIALVFAFFGLILLCDIKDFNIQKYDLYLIICALLYAMQILLLGKATKTVDAIKLSCIQYYFVFIFNFVTCFVSKDSSLVNFKQALPSILYLGIGATTIAYTLQAVGQKTVHSNVASFIISLESVFGLIAGYLILNQIPSNKELIGCVLLFIGVFISTIPFKKT